MRNMRLQHIIYLSVFRQYGNGSANWFVETSETWELINDGASYSGFYHWDDSPEDFYGNDVNTSLVIANDVTTNEQTQITFLA